MSKFNFSHGKESMHDSFGLPTMETVGNTVSEWSDELSSVSQTVERLRNHDSFTEDEKLFGMFVLGMIYSAAMHDFWVDQGIPMPIRNEKQGE